MQKKKLEVVKLKQKDEKDNSKKQAKIANNSSLKRQKYKKGNNFKKSGTAVEQKQDNEIKLPPRTYVPDENDYEKRYERLNQQQLQQQQNRNYQYPQQNYNNYNQ
jgi:hypothetical protein